MLTDRQQEIYDFVVEYVENRGYPPTVREIGERVGLASPSTVHAHLATLEREGLIRRDPTKPRALELPQHQRATAVTLNQSARAAIRVRVRNERVATRGRLQHSLHP